MTGQLFCVDVVQEGEKQDNRGGVKPPPSVWASVAQAFDPLTRGEPSPRMLGTGLM